MNNQVKKILLVILCCVLGSELLFVGFAGRKQDSGDQLSLQVSATEAASTEPGTLETDPAPASEPQASETVEPTETVPATEAPTEQRFVLTFAGDCTLGTDPDNWNNLSSYVKTIGEDYDYPFANVREYFENDDYTMVNLEVALTDTVTTVRSKLFTFRGPTAYTQILTGSSVEGVTLANNHSMDFGQSGYDSTKAALESAGIDYVEQDSSTMVTTESGLKIGIYAVDGSVSTIPTEQTLAGIRKLKQEGAELIIVAAHWGNEGKYRPNSNQQELGKAMIDAGADIIFGHHPHVLQKIEEYNGGIIYYSLGNFSFGGNTNPKDKDSAIVQQEVIRDPDGTIRLGELTVIPCSISSVSNLNNYQPTPMKEGSTEYERAMTKLNGTFKGADLVVDYSRLEDDDDPTEPAATTPPAATEGGDSGSSGGDSGASSGGDSGASSGGDSGASSGGDSGASSGGDSGASSGGDSGASSGGDSGASSGGDSGASSGGDSGASSGGDSGASSGGDSGSSGGEA